MGKTALQPESATRQKTLAIRSPAKINLCLEVLGRRGDGYHDIHSLVIGVSLFDRLTVTYPKAVGLTVNSSDPTLHTESSRATRGALLVARQLGCDPQARIDSEKNIPMGAG